MRIEPKTSSVLIHDITEKPIKIPSAMYPLTGDISVMTYDNTEPFDEKDERTLIIREVFDSIQAGIGTCYTNTENLINALKEKGINARTYVGWIFVGNDLPVHHCFTVIDNHILDFNIRYELMCSNPKIIELVNQGAAVEKVRELLTDDIISLNKNPNSEVRTFGKLSKGLIYFVSPCKPMEGLKIYQKLMQAYPKHPCYTNINSKGMSATQEMILKKQGKI